MNKFQEEYDKCKEDFSYFAANYLEVIHPTYGLIRFSMHDFQKRLAKCYDENRFVIVKKFRQGGFSTMTVLYCLWQCIFNPDRRVLFVGRTDRDVVELGRIIDKTIGHMPEAFRPRLSFNTDHCKKFENNSEMSFTTPLSSRGNSFTHLVIDEAAFIPEMDTCWSYFYSMINNNGKMLCSLHPK